MIAGIATLSKLPDMEAAISCGAGIALSVFIPYYILFVSLFHSSSRLEYSELLQRLFISRVSAEQET